MVDAAHLDYAENVAVTAEITAEAHRTSLWVEAELGEIGGKNGAHAPGVRTDPLEAAAFVAETRVDGLAVAVGSSHAMTTATADLDLDLIERLAETVPVPLVLHGSSGVPTNVLRDAVARGIRKINVGTALNIGYTDRIRASLDADAHVTDPRRYLAPARDAVTESAGSAQRAARLALIGASQAITLTKVDNCMKKLTSLAGVDHRRRTARGLLVRSGRCCHARQRAAATFEFPPTSGVFDYQLGGVVRRAGSRRRSHGDRRRRARRDIRAARRRLRRLLRQRISDSARRRGVLARARGPVAARFER